MARRTRRKTFGGGKIEGRVITTLPKGARIPRGKAPPVYDAVKKGNTVYHARCGGQIMIDGRVYPMVDFGFGFASDGKFEVRKVYSDRVEAYGGQCLKCGKKGYYVIKRRQR